MPASASGKIVREGPLSQFCMLQRNKITKKLKSSWVKIKTQPSVLVGFWNVHARTRYKFGALVQLHFLATSVSLCLCMRLEGHLSHSPAAILHAGDECVLVGWITVHAEETTEQSAQCTYCTLLTPLCWVSHSQTTPFPFANVEWNETICTKAEAKEMIVFQAVINLKCSSS